jgi:hypothetical protein
MRRANAKPDWRYALSGRPQLAYEFWDVHLKPLGFGLKPQILDYPGGVPPRSDFLMW